MSRERDAAEKRDAMTKTVEEARLLADERRADGWDAVVVPAADTAAVPSDAETGEWGFVHVVPDNYADRITAASKAGSFPRYDVYRRRVGETVCFVTELLDPDTDTVLLVAGQYDTGEAVGLYREATHEGVVHTRLRRLDGEPLATVEHDAVEKFFPEEMASLSGRQ